MRGGQRCGSLSSFGNYHISKTNVGNEAFYGCDGLTSIVIPENVTWIGYQAFGKCANLTEATVILKKDVLLEKSDITDIFEESDKLKKIDVKYS